MTPHSMYRPLVILLTTLALAAALTAGALSALAYPPRP